MRPVGTCSPRALRFCQSLDTFAADSSSALGAGLGWSDGKEGGSNVPVSHSGRRGPSLIVHLLCTGSCGGYLFSGW